MSSRSTDQQVTTDRPCGALCSPGLARGAFPGRKTIHTAQPQPINTRGLPDVMVSHAHQNQVEQTETSEGCKFLGISHGFREMKIFYKSFHSLGNLGTWLFLEQ